jgi:hypothetical protein
MLPNITPLQYLVLHLLFAGRRSGEQLRRDLRSLGVGQSRAAFSRLMDRLIEANYVCPQPLARNDNGHTVYYRSYEVTDLGVLQWTAARKFYLNLAPPSHDLLPVESQCAELSVYDRQDCETIVKREVNDFVRQAFSSALGVLS